MSVFVSVYVFVLIVIVIIILLLFYSLFVLGGEPLPGGGPVLNLNLGGAHDVRHHARVGQPLELRRGLHTKIIIIQNQIKRNIIAI